ncbi:MAG: integration host factor subunit beta [Treponema sp.]|jgi:integration host factor subunit beta|nr:integration host factor subunit beta [Treponema sp.]
MAVSKYTKADIVDLVCEKTGASRKEIRIVIDLFIDELKRALGRSRVIELRGFGTFEIKARKGRARARNPKTGKYVEVTSHSIAVFRPGRELKKAVWNLTPATLAGEEAKFTAAGPEGDGGKIAGNDEPNF